MNSGGTHTYSLKRPQLPQRERGHSSTERRQGRTPVSGCRIPDSLWPPHRLFPWPLVRDVEALLVLHPPGPTLPRAPGPYSVFAEPTRSPASHRNTITRPRLTRPQLALSSGWSSLDQAPPSLQNALLPALGSRTCCPPDAGGNRTHHPLTYEQRHPEYPHLAQRSICQAGHE